MPSLLSLQLERQIEHLNRHHPRQRLLCRWATDPALSGRTPLAIIELCGQSTTEQNPVVAALLRHHQAGDPDAGLVLLTALRPMLKAVVSYHHRRITDDLIDNYWSAASHLIGATDPDHEPVDRNGRPTPFITHLGNRLHQHARYLDPAARRWRNRLQRGAVTLPLDVARRSSELLDHDARRETSSVEDIVLARIELGEVAAAVSSGEITADRWQRLVEHRLGARTDYASGAERVAIHRTATRLAGLVGHAA